jgi:3-dehydroquinate synthase
MTSFELRHGEAVAIGMALDIVYSALSGLLPWPAAREMLDCLRALGFELAHPALDRGDALLAGLAEFREHLGGTLTITLLRGIARPVEVHEMDRALVMAAAEHLRQGRWAAPTAAAG